MIKSILSIIQYISSRSFNSCIWTASILMVFVIQINQIHAQSNQFSILRIETNSVSFKSNMIDENRSIEVLLDDKIIRKKDWNNNDELLIEGLNPSTIYQVKIMDGSGQVCDSFPIITKSLSSGEIRIFFNVNTDESFSYGPLADGESADVMEEAIIDLIDSAQHTLSICTYNTNREGIVEALRRAHNRGVEVRLITDIDRNNFGLASNIPFPVLRGANGDGIMHNKFIIIDEEYDDLAWVQTGSVNYTDFQMTVDPNHAIMIQDKSLAQVYLTEFNEMWGGSGSNPITGNTKFGQSKADNTPHLLNINGIEIQSYFSPSDNTDSFIVDRIDAAQDEINVAMLIFTRWELRDALIAAYNRGVTVKVLVEDQENSQDVLDRFEQAGLTTYYIDDEQTLLHHKYAIIDEGSSSGDPYVITGSQNWTYSGNTFNDENTLIFKDADIANIFRQEFQNLWRGNATSIDQSLNNEIELKVSVENDMLNILSSKPYQSVIISSMNGQQIYVKNNKSGNINVSHLPQGIYAVTLRIDHQYHTSKIYIN